MTQPAQDTVLEYLSALRDRGEFGRLLSADVVFEAPGVWSVRGAGEVERSVRHHYEVEFDARPELVSLVADDRTAAAEVVFAGRHTGEYNGVAATGATVRVPLSMVFDVEDARIIAIRVYYSPEQLMAQLIADREERDR